MQPRNIEGPQRAEEGGEGAPWLKLGGWTVFGLAVCSALCVVSSWTVREIQGAWAGGASWSSAATKEKLRQRRDSPSVSSAKVCACMHAYCVVFRFEPRCESGQLQRGRGQMRSGGLPFACQALALTNVPAPEPLLLLPRCSVSTHHQDTTYRLVLQLFLINAERKMYSKFAAPEQIHLSVSPYATTQESALSFTQRPLLLILSNVNVYSCACTTQAAGASAF